MSDYDSKLLSCCVTQFKHNDQDIILSTYTERDTTSKVNSLCVLATDGCSNGATYKETYSERECKSMHFPVASTLRDSICVGPIKATETDTSGMLDVSIGVEPRTVHLKLKKLPVIEVNTELSAMVFRFVDHIHELETTNADLAKTKNSALSNNITMADTTGQHGHSKGGRRPKPAANVSIANPHVRKRKLATIDSLEDDDDNE